MLARQEQKRKLPVFFFEPIASGPSIQEKDQIWNDFWIKLIFGNMVTF